MDITLVILGDAFIHCDLQLIRLSAGQSSLEQCGVKGLAQGPNGCMDLMVAALGIEPPTSRVPGMYLSRSAPGWGRGKHSDGKHSDAPSSLRLRMRIWGPGLRSAVTSIRDLLFS